MKIQITQSREIKIDFLNSYVQKHTTLLVLDEWTFVSATFLYLAPKTVNYIQVCSNIIVGTNSLTFDPDIVSTSKFPGPGPSALFRIGGSPSFIGEISNMNFYNPGALIPPGKHSFS